MLVSNHMLKRLSGGFAVAALVVAVAVPSALAGSFITDTLGGNGSPKVATPDAFERAVAIHNAQPYVNAGMSASVATSNDPVPPSVPAFHLAPGNGFNWGDAGIGAGFAVGLALLLLLGGPRLRGHKSRVLAT
jgi:hypothetical protein